MQNDTTQKESIKRIGFFLRVFAAVIDGIFLLILFAAILIAWETVSDLEMHEKAADIGLFGTWVAYTLTEIFTAGTPGKLVLRQRITCGNAVAADGWRLFLRWSAKQSPLILHLLYLATEAPGFWLLGGFCTVIVLIGCLYASTDDKRAWHDLWAGTAVIHRSSVVDRDSSNLAPANK